MKDFEIIINYLFESQKQEKNKYIKLCTRKYINFKLNYLFQLYCEKIKLCNQIIKSNSKNINSSNWEQTEIKNIEYRNKIFEYENCISKISYYYEKNY